MSKQLSIAATLSVLMMTSFALFGAQGAKLPQGLSYAASPLHVGVVKIG